MDVNVTSTPLRRTNKKTINQDRLTALTPINHVQQDEAERRNRRSLASIQKRLSAIPSQGSPQLNSSMSVDVEVVEEHYKECQKLFAENKINKKNVWNLKLIDYLNVLISQNIIATSLMLIAATSLDICVKVFACRVDDVHERCFQLFSSVTTLKRQEAAEDERIDDGDVEVEGEKRQSKKKKKARRLSVSQKHTIAKDAKSLEVANIPKMSSVVFVGHINIDASNNENLLTNKLPLHHIGHKVVLLDKVNQGLPFYDEDDLSIKQNHMTTLKINPGAFVICRAFTGFHIDEWDLDQEEAQIAEMNQKPKSNPLGTDELVYDEQGVPVAELDGSIHDIFADEHANDMLEEDQDVDNVAILNQEEEFISSFCPTEMRNLANNDMDPWWKQRVWIGPSHWKNKFIKQRADRFTGRINKEAPMKTKRKHQLISMDIDFSVECVIDMSKKYKSKKIKHDVQKVTLPVNYLPHLPDHRLLLLKPFVSQNESPAKSKEDEYEHSPYDYNNPNDSQYCSQHSVPDELGDDNEPPFENDIVHEEEHIENCERNRENTLTNLVEAPEMVQQTYISYALRAKKMNMKKLKDAIWELLTEDANTNNVKEMNLSLLHSTLPSRLPQIMRMNLSIHLTFMAVLDLTNQHNLKLTRQADLTDFRIGQDKQ